MFAYSISKYNFINFNLCNYCLEKNIDKNNNNESDFNEEYQLSTLEKEVSILKQEYLALTKQIITNDGIKEHNKFKHSESDKHKPAAIKNDRYVLVEAIL